MDKRYIFTITSGRTGTGYLAYLLSLFPGVESHHEGSPSFVQCMREAQTNPEVAEDFLWEIKFPAIRSEQKQSIYVDTGHLFGKGFLEPWLKLGYPVPDLILLDRDFRLISLSLLKLDTIPGRSKLGLDWCLSPSDPTCLTRIESWQELNDYQLCYWYCLETEARKAFYARLIAEHGGRAVHTSIDELMTVAGLLKLKKELDLPDLSLTGWLRYFKNRGRRVNSKKQADIPYSEQQLAEWEEEVSSRTKNIQAEGSNS